MFASIQAVLAVLVCMGSGICCCAIVNALPFLRMHAKTAAGMFMASACYTVVVALMQISAKVAWDGASCWSSPGSAGQEQEWVAARMAEMGSSSCIKPASTPSLIRSA